MPVRCERFLSHFNLSYVQNDLQGADQSSRGQEYGTYKNIILKLFKVSKKNLYEG